MPNGTMVVQDMPVQEVAQLKEKIQQVDHVESVLWYDSVAGPLHPHGAAAG